MAIRGLIFDFNGTLFWDTPIQEAAWQKFALLHAGRRMTQAEFAALHGRPNPFWIQKLLGYLPADPKDVQALAEKKETMYRQMCLEAGEAFRLAPGVEELLCRMQEKNIPFAIATSADKANVDFYFEHMNLGKYFSWDRVLYANPRVPSKPHPAFYQEAARMIGLPPEECAVAEDMHIGVQSAHDAGIGRVVGVCSTGREALQGNPYVDVFIDDYYRPELWLDALND